MAYCSNPLCHRKAGDVNLSNQGKQGEDLLLTVLLVLPDEMMQHVDKARQVNERRNCTVLYCTVPTVICVSTAVLNNNVEHCSGDNTWDSVMRSVWVYCIHATRSITTINTIDTLSRRYFQYAHFIPIVGVGKRGVH